MEASSCLLQYFLGPLHRVHQQSHICMADGIPWLLGYALVGTGGFLGRCTIWQL